MIGHIQRASRVPLLVAVVAFAILFLRRPATLMRAEFWADDGHFYQDARDFGLQTIATADAGYLSTTQRIVALIETAVPPVWAPVVGNVIALIITTLVAADAALQAVTFAATATSTRDVHVPPDLALVPSVVITQTTRLPVAAGILLIVAVAVVSWRSRGPSTLALWLLAITFPLVGLLMAIEPTAIIGMGHAPCYFWLSTGLLATIVVIAGPSLLRSARLALFVVVFASEALIPSIVVAGWRDTASCIGGPLPCVVHVEPAAQWNVHWR